MNGGHFPCRCKWANRPPPPRPICAMQSFPHLFQSSFLLGRGDFPWQPLVPSSRHPPPSCQSRWRRRGAPHICSEALAPLASRRPPQHSPRNSLARLAALLRLPGRGAVRPPASAARAALPPSRLQTFAAAPAALPGMPSQGRPLSLGFPGRGAPHPLSHAAESSLTAPSGSLPSRRAARGIPSRGVSIQSHAEPAPQTYRRAGA